MKTIKFLLKWNLFILFASVLLFGCRKHDVEIQQTEKNNEQLNQQFFNTSKTSDVEILNLANDLKKNSGLMMSLSKFMEKNGVPVWDKVIYKTKNSAANKLTNNLNNTSGNTNNAKGVFLIPLESQNSNSVKSYITASKHSDSVYSYRLYNKDSLDKIKPTDNALKYDLLNLKTIFGYFDKNINNKDSIHISTPYNLSLSNVNINFGDATTNKLASSVKNKDVTTNDFDDCYELTTITLQYTTISAGNLIGFIHTIILDIKVDCSGTGSGGTDIGSTGWWNNGTGLPYQYNNNNNGTLWQWFWAGSFNTTPGQGLTQTVTYLKNSLQLNFYQEQWLDQGPDRAAPIYNYLQSTNDPNAIQKCIEHIDLMMNNLQYYNFVNFHDSNNPNYMWWEDENWLKNADNFDLDTDDDKLYGKTITSQELVLTKQSPLAAFLINQNSETARTYTKANFNGLNGLNDKSDAFRHGFFQAINAVDLIIGPTITKLFADAHETNTPTPLQLESQMDNFNNTIGITYGSTVGLTASIYDIVQGILLKLTNGELRYLSPIDKTISLPYDKNNDGIQDCPTCLNGILPTTILIPTNQ